MDDKTNSQSLRYETMCEILETGFISAEERGIRVSSIKIDKNTLNLFVEALNEGVNFKIEGETKRYRGIKIQEVDVEHLFIEVK